MDENAVFEQIGENGFRRIGEEFYAQIPGDDLLGPMYPQDDLAGAEKRLADFLIYRFGGPQTYIEERGHPRLRMRHMPFTIDEKARDRWMEIMSSALEKAEIPDPALTTLRNFFEQMSTFLINANPAS